MEPLTPAEAYDLIADDYDRIYQSPIELSENEALRRMLDPLVWAGGRQRLTSDPILDAGCGTGLLLEQFPIPPDEYIGVDVSPKMLKHARAKFPAHTFIEADLSSPAAWRDIIGRDRVGAVVALFCTYSYFSLDYAAAQMAEIMRPWTPFFVMLYGYSTRPKVFSNGHVDAPHRRDTPTAAAHAFSTPEWRDVEVRGFSSVRVLPSATYLVHESRSLGRIWPSAGRYLVVTGRRSTFTRPI